MWQPTRVHELDAVGVLDIACAETATLALCNDTNVYSVGTGVSGQLGHKDMVHEKLVKFRKVGAWPPFPSIALLSRFVVDPAARLTLTLGAA